MFTSVQLIQFTVKCTRQQCHTKSIRECEYEHKQYEQWRRNAVEDITTLSVHWVESVVLIV